MLVVKKPACWPTVFSRQGQPPGNPSTQGDRVLGGTGDRKEGGKDSVERDV